MVDPFHLYEHLPKMAWERKHGVPESLVFTEAVRIARFGKAEDHWLIRFLAAKREHLEDQG